MGDATVERFRALVGERFRFLETHGFRRSRADEHDSPVGASVVYVGNHLRFVIAYDIRDAQVDVRVARAGAGACSRDLLSHLVEHAGYRGAGSPAGAAPAAHESEPLERMVGWWAELLTNAGAALLADSPDALPGG